MIEMIAWKIIYYVICLLFLIIVGGISFGFWLVMFF